jgi:hypothetical protein
LCGVSQSFSWYQSSQKTLAPDPTLASIDPISHGHGDRTRFGNENGNRNNGGGGGYYRKKKNENGGNNNGGNRSGGNDHAGEASRGVAPPVGPWVCFNPYMGLA